MKKEKKQEKIKSTIHNFVLGALSSSSVFTQGRKS